MVNKKIQNQKIFETYLSNNTFFQNEVGSVKYKDSKGKGET